MKNKFIITNNLIITFSIFFMIITLFTIAALIPRSLIEYSPPGGDDFMHIYIFSTLSLLLCFSKILDKKYIYLILFSYGFLIEILQLIVGRNFSYFDILINCIGIILGAGIYFCFNKIINLKKNF